MIYWRTVTTVLFGFCLGWSPANAEYLAECPNPIFECLGPGPGGTPPGDPPDPLFRPVYPIGKSGVDFNTNYGVIEDGTVTMSIGAPEIGSDLSSYLARHRVLIDPNAIYLLSPQSIDQDNMEGDGLLVGGGALTQ